MFYDRPDKFFLPLPFPPHFHPLLQRRPRLRAAASISMPKRLPPLNALRSFLVAAEQLNFRRAALELHVTPAAISQQIRSLEAHLGSQLFIRDARGLRLTAAGEALLPQTREGFACLERAQAALIAGKPQAVLRIGAPAAFASRWLVAQLGDFSARHPQIALHLGSSADYIDSDDKAQLKLPPDIDVLIRYGSGDYASAQASRLLAEDYRAIGQPALFRRSQPFAEWLADQTLLHDDSLPEAGPRPSWSDWCRLAAVSGIDCQRGPRFSNTVLVREAALAGQGIALLQKMHIADDLAAGRLMLVHPRGLPSPCAYHLLLRDAGHPHALAFANWLRELCARREENQAPAAASGGRPQ